MFCYFHFHSKDNSVNAHGFARLFSHLSGFVYQNKRKNIQKYVLYKYDHFVYWHSSIVSLVLWTAYILLEIPTLVKDFQCYENTSLDWSSQE